jgi:soluble lytic murein transglycosylase-like protein
LAAPKGASIVVCAALSAVAGWNMSFAPSPDPLASRRAPPVATVAPPRVETVVLRSSVDGLEIMPPEPEVSAPVVTEPLLPLRRRHHADVGRWSALIDEASARFGVPVAWIRAVILQESGGRTSLTGNAPITSRAGAMGLMQLMPETYREMRREYGLGFDPYDPHDNIIAGTAYLSWLHTRYGYPGLFAAYNHGPGNFERHLSTGRQLPRETRDYLAAVTADVRRVPQTTPDSDSDLRPASSL